ncbi:MAG: DUF3043 domain-containing protein [Propionibacteriaceae bacterium]|jgi:hypothetical protein|nr:DUF3043 domain-containing protein [Propionibacteriaceae bacterium]
MTEHRLRNEGKAVGLFRPYQPKPASTGSANDDSVRDDRAAPPSPPSTGPAPSASKPAVAPAPQPPRSAAASTPPAPSGRTKKAAPTPTRKQSIQARQARLNPVLNKKQVRLRERQARDKVRSEGWDRTQSRPVMAMIRDYIDVRLSIGEFALPLMLLILVAMFLGGRFPSLVQVTFYATWGLFALLIGDTVLMWLGCKAAIRQHFPDEPLKGKLGYAMSRAMMMRRARQPRARVKRFSKFNWPPAESN